VLVRAAPQSAFLRFGQFRTVPHTRFLSSEAKAEEEVPEATEKTTEELLKEQEGVYEKKIASLNEKVDQLMRALAEADNTVRRARQDGENARKFALQSFAKDLLEVADTLGNAISDLQVTTPVLYLQLDWSLRSHPTGQPGRRQYARGHRANRQGCAERVPQARYRQGNLR